MPTCTHLAPMARSVQPTVASAKSPFATSLATLAPMRTDMSTSGALGPFFISAASRSEIRMGLESLNSMPLISEMPTAPGAKAPCKVSGLGWSGLG